MRGFGETNSISLVLQYTMIRK